MALPFTGSVKSGMEQLFLTSQIKNTIVKIWFDLIRASLTIEMSDKELLTRLRIILETFVDEVNKEWDENSIKEAENLLFSLQKEGFSNSDLIEIILLFSNAIRFVEVSNPQEFQGSEISNSKPLSLLANQTISKKLAILFNQAVAVQKQSQERTATLLRVAKACSSSLNLETVLQTISDEIIQALDAYALNSFLFSDRFLNGNYYLLNHFSPIGYNVPDPPEPFTLEVLQRGIPITCYDAALDPRTDKKTVEFFGLKSLMAFPLISKGKTIAAGLIVMKDYHHFTQEEVDFVMGIANTGALAVENARVHEKSIQIAIAQERSLLAREIHDRMAQNLVGIKINLNLFLMENLENSDNEKLMEIKALIDETSKDLRDAIHGLRSLSDTDYCSVLNEFKSHILSYGAHRDINIHFNFDETDVQQLSGQEFLQIGRIIEEAVVNACKHSNAKHIWINSEIKEGMVLITIEDDGIGINLKNRPGTADGHFGLKIMEERAVSVGGHFAISRRLEGGTSVSIIIPNEVINQNE